MSISYAAPSGMSPFAQPYSFGSAEAAASAYQAPVAQDTPAWTVNLAPYLAGFQAATPAVPPATQGQSASQTLHEVARAARRFIAWLKGTTTAPTPVSPATPGSPSPTPATPGAQTRFEIASFNVLGYAHTQPSGNEPWMGSGITRMDRAVSMLKARNVDVAGFQEMETPQAQEFLKQAGNEYTLYPGLNKRIHDSQNSIAWRKDKWDLVQAQTFPVHYFNGNIRHMPIVLLRNKQTGQEAYFVNVHNPADTKQHPNQGQWRAADMPIEAQLMNQLKATGLPVFFTGDFNDKQGLGHLDAAGTAMHSASQGPNGKLQKGQGIDWVLGSPGVQFSNYVKDRGAFDRQTSDHPMVSATATIG